MQHMVKDHTNDVSEFQKEASNGKDSDVKSRLPDHTKAARAP